MSAARQEKVRRKSVEIKAYQVWFNDGSAVLLDAESAAQARAIALDRIQSGQYHGKVTRVKCLDTDDEG